MSRITSCTDDHEEDFYYTEVELDSPLDDSSGVSSAGQSPISNLQSQMHKPSTNNSNNNLSKTTTATTKNTTSTSIVTHANSQPVIIKQVRKRVRPKPRNKDLIIESSNNFNFNHQRFNSAIATWMHMDMARPAHEDPEYKAKFNNSNETTVTTIKRERKRAASNQYVSDHSDYELNAQHPQPPPANYLQNLSAEQLVKLQKQNSLHLKNNIQHLQQLQRQHQQLNQLHQLHQYHQQIKRKYIKNHHQPNGISQKNASSILMPATTARTKSVICTMAQLENEFEHHLLNNSTVVAAAAAATTVVNNLSPNPLKRSKPIKIPGISLAHRDYHQQPNQSSTSSFTVGSVQLSQNGYFHCFSPTPPHSLSSPTSTNSSMYSLGSCNSPGSSSIASNSSSTYSPNAQSLGCNRNSAHYSPIDTLLQTVENERSLQQQQQLAIMEDESLQSDCSFNSKNSSNCKKLPKLKSANVSDLDLVAQNEDEDDYCVEDDVEVEVDEDEDEFSFEQQQQTTALNFKT